MPLLPPFLWLLLLQHFALASPVVILACSIPVHLGSVEI
jgi:hypothetical protein